MTIENEEEKRQEDLSSLLEQFESASIKYQNLRDRQSFRILGSLSGILLALIGLILGQNWPIRLAVFLCGVVILVLSLYFIPKVSRIDLDQKEAEVISLRDQLDAAHGKRRKWMLEK